MHACACTHTPLRTAPLRVSARSPIFMHMHSPAAGCLCVCVYTHIASLQRVCAHVEPGCRVCAHMYSVRAGRVHMHGPAAERVCVCVCVCACTSTASLQGGDVHAQVHHCTVPLCVCARTSTASLRRVHAQARRCKAFVCVCVCTHKSGIAATWPCGCPCVCTHEYITARHWCACARTSTASLQELCVHSLTAVCVCVCAHSPCVCAHVPGCWGDAPSLAQHRRVLMGPGVLPPRGSPPAPHLRPHARCAARGSMAAAGAPR